MSATLRTVSFLAVKDLKRDKKIAMLVIFLLAFSYFNITFFAAFINGVGNTFQNEIVNTATSHIYITPSETGNQKYINDLSSLKKKVELNPDVVATAARINVPLTISYKSKQFSLSAVALKPSDEAYVSTILTYILDGSFLTDQSNDEIVLGRFIAGEQLENTIGRQTFGQLVQGLDVKVGEVVTVTYPDGTKKDYRVKGIVGSDSMAAVSQEVFITFNEGSRVLGISDQASNFLIKINNKYNADSVKKAIMESGIKNVEIKTWIEASSFVGAINAAFGIVTMVTSFVGVIVVISTIGIVIFINTARKKRIIGVLKAIGMSSYEIMLIFLLESVIFGIVGSLVGVGIFSAMTFYTNSNPIALPIGKLYPSLSNDAIVGAALMIIIISLLAGYLPARQASKQKILETIKTVE